MIKFLCDVHIAYRITKFLATQGVEAEHVNRILDCHHQRFRFPQQSLYPKNTA